MAGILKRKTRELASTAHQNIPNSRFSTLPCCGFKFEGAEVAGTLKSRKARESKFQIRAFLLCLAVALNLGSWSGWKMEKKTRMRVYRHPKFAFFYSALLWPQIRGSWNGWKRRAPETSKIRAFLLCLAVALNLER